MPADQNDGRRAILTEIAVRNLLAHSLDGLRALVTPSSLAEAAGIPRQSAYRAFSRSADSSGNSKATRDPAGDVLRAVVDLVNTTPDTYGFHAAYERAEAHYARQPNDPASGLKGGLAIAVELQFQTRGHPLGWMLHAATLTSSDLWKGDPETRPVDPKDRDLAEYICAARRQYYSTLRQTLDTGVQTGMNDLNRRPIAEMTPALIGSLMHALLDGAVLHMYLGLSEFTTQVVADALFALAEALTEAGPSGDPRRPKDAGAAQAFDRFVEVAMREWEAADHDVSLAGVAEKADVTEQVLQLTFPTLADLADSAIRCAAFPAGLEGGWTEKSQLAGGLRRLREARAKIPRAFDVVDQAAPGDSTRYFDDVLQAATRAIRELASDRPDPEKDANFLMKLTRQPELGWDLMLGVLATMGIGADADSEM